MASISRDSKGRRTIQFVAADGKRKSIRLGKVSQRVAESVRVKVEQLNAALIAASPMDDETARWVAGLGDSLANKLAAVGLIRERGIARLGEFLDTFIAKRTDAKPSTVLNFRVVKARLIEFFSPDKNIRDITPGDADAWLVWLRQSDSNGKQRCAESTAGRSVRRAKQFFRAALRQKLISENPFADVKALSEANEARKFFVSPEVAQGVIGACPDTEWRLIFALSRYGALRCPSEHLVLEWTDVDWEKDRMLVRSPKTGHRWVPIFAELRPYLEEAFELAEPGALYVINRYRDTNANLRTQLMRIIKRAGLKPWPKLFHNLRASRETELAERFPIHVVCKWVGHAARIAQKHYLQVTDDHFERAAKSGAVAVQNAVQQPAARSRTEAAESTQLGGDSDVVLARAAPCETVQDRKAPRVGLEPTTNRLTAGCSTIELSGKIAARRA